MNSVHNHLSNPLVEGIKIIGIGKHGSKPLPLPLIDEIATYLQTQEVIPIQKGAFIGALMAKGPTEEEQRLLLNQSSLDPARIYEALCSDTPDYMQPLGVKLLKKAFLNVEEARQLGEYLFSDQPGEAFRGMAASMLRIRYETEEEYQGLMAAAAATYTPGFRHAPSTNQPLIQLAEPFDGVEHSYMITPLLAQLLQQSGYKVIVSMGRNGGPKLQLNTLDIYQALGSPFIQHNDELQQAAPTYGWALEQQVLSPALDKWVDRRLLLFKRPFLATLEKVLNPCKASILITSVFHITYIEKMITLAGMAGFSGVIVLKRGLEGTLAPSIAKASGITCAVRQKDGSFLTQTFEANQEALTTYRAEADATVTDLSLADNIELIKHYSQQGSTGHADFDKRMQLATALYKQGLEWIEQQWS